MPKIPMTDPGSTEIESPLIAGLSEGVSKLSAILDLTVGQLTDYALQNVPSDDGVTSRIFQAKSGQRLWLVDPAPVFKKNGEVITAETDYFTIDFVGGSITFEEKHILDPNDTVTVSCSYITDASETINNINTALTALTALAGHYKGAYTNETELNANNPTGENGDYAIVLSTGSVFVWKDTAWKNSQSIEDLTNYYTKDETNDLLDTKELVIAKKSGDNPQDYYYSGEKTWLDINNKVRSTSLSGLVTNQNESITDTDSVVSGMGKLQAQIDNKQSYIQANQEPTTATVGKIGQRYVNTSNGNWYILKTIEEDGSYIWEDYYNKEETNAFISNIHNTMLYTYKALYSLDNWTGNDTDGYTQTVTVQAENEDSPAVTADTQFSAPMTVPTGVKATDEALMDALSIINAGFSQTGNGTVTTKVWEQPQSDIMVYWYGN